MERITRAQVDARVENLNRRMEARGSIYRYIAEGRNGHIGLDRIAKDDPQDPRQRFHVVGTVTVGTKREVAEFLHAMMVALDDAAVTS